MKKLIALIIVILVVVIAYMYVVRPAAAPSNDINQASQKLPAGSATSTVYRISQDESKVEFRMNELLRGNPFLVIGTTNQIAGDVSVKDGDIEIGTLTINARTFKTDSTNRDGAINNLILKTANASNEFITFKPTSNDFTGRIEEGKPATFNVTGDLTISGVTKPTTFKVNMTVASSTVTGTAETRIKRSDFNLVIPNIPFVANVDDEFPIKADVVAQRIAQ